LYPDKRKCHEHLLSFQGGYSAGYYSYKWAEVLDADAILPRKGIFNKEVLLNLKTIFYLKEDRTSDVFTKLQRT
jgi:peptidyl-dipeptidase Dcp